ncbi:glycosyltransferase family 39 protein [Maridesulfovibrio sp.]|uniref:glycosyltransferase family 39 protein n=1 Tax=unclassified Maridesulfovibrio TaxID=2794999 RepID=UPI003AFFEED9
MAQASKNNYALWLILLLATVLRVYGIADESLWIDEGQTVAYATKSFAEIVKYCARDVHPPLYLFIMHIWTEIFGISETALRMISAIFGIISVQLTYKIGLRLMNRNGALLSALFMAVSYMGINFSQEARSYTMLLCAILMSSHGLLKFIERQDKFNFAYYATAVALMLYTHTFTVFIILFHQIYYIVDWSFRRGERMKRFTNWVAVNIAALVLFGPWMYFLLKQVLAKLGGEGPGSWVMVPDHITAYRTFIQLAGGVFPLMIAVLAVLAFAAVKLIPALRTRFSTEDEQPQEVRSALFLSLWFLCAVVTPFAVSLILSPIYVERYAIQFLPGFCMFLGLIMSGFAPRGLRYAVAGLFMLATVHSLWLYYTTYDKEQWREVAHFIAENVKPGDAVVLSAPWIYEPFTYYLPDDGDPKIIQAFSHVDLRGETDKFGTIWLVQAHEFFSDPGGEIPAMLSENRLIKQHKDFKEGVKTNPILVHFQSIRATKYDAGRMQEYLRIGSTEPDEKSGGKSLVSGLADSLIVDRQDITPTGQFSFATGPDSRLRYRFALKTKAGEGAVSFRILPEWENKKTKRMLFMGKGPKWDKGSVFLELTPDNRLQAIFFKDGYSGMVQGPPIELSRQWHSLSIVWERKKAMIYVDGKEYAIAGLPTPFQPDFKTLHLGADHQNNFPAQAEFDDLMIFQAPLSPEATDELHDTGKAAPVYWYDLDLAGKRTADMQTEGLSSGKNQFFTAVTPNIDSSGPVSGEISFTFIPEWSGGNGKQRVLLAFNGQDWNRGSMYLEKTPQDFLQLIRWEKGKPACVVGLEIKDWQKREPHKISVSWNTEGIALTIDGKEQSGKCNPKSMSKFKSLSIGNDIGGNLPAEGKFEEVRIN